MKKIYCIYKQGRESRFKLIKRGQAPKEFFYGFFGLVDKGYQLVRLNNNFKSKNIIHTLIRCIELIFNHLHRLGLSPSTIYQNIKNFSNGSIIISFTDGMSLTLGFFSRVLKNKNIYLIGCFHCLSDYDNRTSNLLKFLSNFIISQSLKKLDHIAFFGPADRQYVIKKYNLNINKTSIIKFGVDTHFWIPTTHKKREFIFSIGQDPNRDFETLIKTNV